MTNLIKESLYMVLFIASFVGLYHEGKKSILRTFLAYFTFFCGCSLPMLIAVNLISAEDISVQQRNQTLFCFVESLGCCLKIIPFLIDPERLKMCIEFFEKKNFNGRHDDDKRILQECANTCRLIVKVFFYLLVCCIILWSVLPLFGRERALPMNAWIPYENSSSVIFCVTYFYIVATLTYQAVVTFFIDPVVAGLAYHARSQLKVLISNLRQLDNFQDEQIKFEQAADILKNCVVHHDNILKFIKKFESCFSWSIFSSISTSIFGLCFCCVQLTMVPLLTVEAMTFVVSYIIIALQILFYCYFGSILFEENEHLITEMYMCSWYRYDVRIRKMLIIMMERAKEPVNLTVGKIIILNLATFTSILKTSYSLMAVLNRQ